jgi:hypothetical protein
MGKTKGPYNPEFAEGTRVRIVESEDLNRFRLEWRWHNPLQDEQMLYAGRIATVKSVGFYHGGDELYQLDGIPGLWHERCLAPAER